MVSPGSGLVPPLLHVDALLVGEDGLTIRAVSEATEARCPHCDETADRVHSRAPRTLADLPWAVVTVQLRVRVLSRSFKRLANGAEVGAAPADGEQPQTRAADQARLARAAPAINAQVRPVVSRFPVWVRE